jgi:hypothetical protein
MHAKWVVAFADLPEEARAGWEYLAHLGSN